MIGARGNRVYCLQCTRARKAINHANRVKWGLAKEDPKPEKPKENYDHVWTWLVDNAPVRKCQISKIMFGDGNRPEQAIYALERAGYLLSEDPNGLLYDWERVR